MKLLTLHDGLVAPMDQNVDTDLMVPKQFLKSIRFGFGPNLLMSCAIWMRVSQIPQASQRP